MPALELSLDFPVDHVMVDKEKSIAYHPEYRSVRLDVYAHDENRTHYYNVEMQVIPKQELVKRARYYHSQMDMKILKAGFDYGKLPKTFS